MAELKRDAEAAVIVSDRGILGGRPIFRGTRVQADIVFENLADGYSLDEILNEFPTLDRDDLRKALWQACDVMKKNAPELDRYKDGRVS